MVPVPILGFTRLCIAPTRFVDRRLGRLDIFAGVAPSCLVSVAAGVRMPPSYGAVDWGWFLVHWIGGQRLVLNQPLTLSSIELEL
jgi:hypothetical protein